MGSKEDSCGGLIPRPSSPPPITSIQTQRGKAQQILLCAMMSGRQRADTQRTVIISA